jgi:hypothetical protein
MSFFSEASLAMIPSGYKTSKVYSALPTSGDGDLTFSRSNDTATRVGPDGLIEKVRTQQYFKSTAFTTSSIFATYNVSPTSLGTYPVYSDSLAYSFPITGVNQGFIFAVASDSNIRAVSVFLKDFGTLDLYYTGSAPLSYGATSEVVNGYTRYIVVIPSGANNLYFRPNGNTGTTTTVYATAPQIEYGDIATAYISNDTTASAVSVGPVANVPRLDYLGSSCPRLLLEPQRTNLAQYSEQFDNANWVKYGGATVTANTVTSPDGYTNADTLNVDSGQEIYATITSKAASAITYTFSCFAKYNSAAVFLLTASDFATSATTASFNLQTGVATFSEGATWSGTSVKMENYGNGWYRCIMTSTSPTTTGLYASLLTSTTGGVYIYGMQCEQAAYETSYIPTLGASVTRAVDYTLKSGSSLAENAKTWFCDVNITEGRVNGSSEMFLTIRGGAYEGYFRYFANNVLHFQYYGVTGSAQIVLNSAIPAGTTARVKMAARIENNDMVFYVNGAQIGTNTTATRGTGMNILEVGTYGVNAGYHISDSVNQIILFPTALTNAQLAELTA